MENQATKQDETMKMPSMADKTFEEMLQDEDFKLWFDNLETNHPKVAAVVRQYPPNQEYFMPLTRQVCAIVSYDEPDKPEDGVEVTFKVVIRDTPTVVFGIHPENLVPYEPEKHDRPLIQINDWKGIKDKMVKDITYLMSYQSAPNLVREKVEEFMKLIEKDINSPHLSRVYIWRTGMIMAFDQFGQQIGKYQGYIGDMKPIIQEDYKEGILFFLGTTPQEGEPNQITYEKFLALDIPKPEFIEQTKTTIADLLGIPESERAGYGEEINQAIFPREVVYPEGESDVKD